MFNVDLTLFVESGKFADNDYTFQVYQSIRPCWHATDSVIILDYEYTPWPRENGNLLWS